MKEILETERLLLRRWREEDAQELYELASNPEVGPPAGWQPHTSVENSREIIRTILDRDGIYALIRRDDGQLVGCAGMRTGEDSCSGKDDEPELGYWIGRQYWGNGYASEASEELVRYGFDELHCPRIWCCYYQGNERSARVMKKLGFRYERMDPEGETMLGFTLPEIVTVLQRPQNDYRFQAQIEAVPEKGGAFVRVPFDIRREFGKGRLRVHAFFDGVPYDGSIVNMGVRNEDRSICYIIGVRKDIQKKMGKSAGDIVDVRIVPIV